MEEEEEARTAVDAETAIVVDKVEAEEITTLARAAQLRNDYVMLLSLACLNMVKGRPQTKQEHHGINLCNTSAQITANI